MTQQQQDNIYTITKLLQNHTATITKPLQNNYNTITNPIIYTITKPLRTITQP